MPDALIALAGRASPSFWNGTAPPLLRRLRHRRFAMHPSARLAVLSPYSVSAHFSTHDVSDYPRPQILLARRQFSRPGATALWPGFLEGESIEDAIHRGLRKSDSSHQPPLFRLAIVAVPAFPDDRVYGRVAGGGCKPNNHRNRRDRLVPRLTSTAFSRIRSPHIDRRHRPQNGQMLK